MNSKERQRPSWALLAKGISVIVVVGAAIGVLYGHNNVQIPNRTYTYRGSDYPQTWEIPKLQKVKLSMENSVHYAIDTELGIAEWNATLPRNGGALYLGDDLRPFSISMFHQLRCLQILRSEIIAQAPGPQKADANPSALAHHCMNYMRQMILCRANLRLESVRRFTGPHVTVPYVTHTCNDWRAVYDVAEENYKAFLRRTSQDSEANFYRKV